MIRTELLRTVIGTEQDIFAVRQRGREVAAAVGLEGQDQIRVATSLSEVGRQMFARLGRTVVVFEVDSGDGGSLLISATAGTAADRRTADEVATEIAVARGLMETWAIEHEEGWVRVTMGRRLPATVRLGEADLDELRLHLARLAPNRPVEEFVLQNQQLMTTLEQVQAHRDQLLAVNSELEETNRGVVALYNQLTEELEATNRGVVALYAELDETSARLREANEAKTRFMANVSHELRSPVTAVIGLVRLLLDAGSEPLTEEQRRQVELIDDSATDMLARVNELLDLAKAESGRLVPVPADVDLRAVFGTLRGTMRALAEGRGVVVEVAEPEVTGLRTDEVMLTQVLRNLMTNGIKFTPRGEVRLTAEHGGTDLVRFTVADTGIGIAEPEQDRVFEEFYQVRGPAQGGTPGTGLGLPYARRLATLLGGDLSLSSVEGEGSTFVVTLPVRLDVEPEAGP